MENVTQICGETIKPGDNRQVLMDIANLASGTNINLPVYIFNGKQNGKRILFTGGLHGDEINGIEIVRRLMSNTKIRKLNRGTVVAIPILNIYGFINFSREVVEGKDMNRSFPGSQSGSLASRVAHVISNEILPHIDLGIDFHTGGNAIHNHPQIRYTKGHKASEELSSIFNAPIAIGTRTIPKSFRDTAIKRNKPIIVFEGGESSRMNEFAINKGVDGSLRLLHEFGLIENNIKSEKAHHYNKMSWLRADRSGLFNPLKQSGEMISKGELLGKIHQIDPKEKVKNVIADRDGLIVGHNNSPVISQGDALFHIAFR